MKSLNNALIFIAGIVCSVGVLELLKHYSSKPSPKYHLPSANFLQVRDEYNVLQYQQTDPGDPLDKSVDTERTKATELEALNSLKVALEMRLDGKEDKAMRLFQHAIALAPKHPDVLTKYGEYLEHNRRDVVTADQMYFQVKVCLSPNLSKFNSI